MPDEKNAPVSDTWLSNRFLETFRMLHTLDECVRYNDDRYCGLLQSREGRERLRDQNNGPHRLGLFVRHSRVLFDIQCIPLFSILSSFLSNSLYSLVFLFFQIFFFSIVFQVSSLFSSFPLFLFRFVSSFPRFPFFRKLQGLYRISLLIEAISVYFPSSDHLLPLKSWKPQIRAQVLDTTFRATPTSSIVPVQGAPASGKLPSGVSLQGTRVS